MPLNSFLSRHKLGPARRGRFHAPLLACAFPFLSQAQSCQVINVTGLDFGTVDNSINDDTQASVTVSCQPLPFISVQMTVCVFIGEGAPLGIAPRYMSNQNGALLRYDIYANPARTQLVGAWGGPQPIYSSSFLLQSQQLITLPLYGRIPAGQNLPAAYLYENLPGSSMVRYSYGPLLLPAPTPQNCRDGTAPLLGGAGIASFSLVGVRAVLANACLITTATDMDFGTSSGLASPRDQTSSIRLRCALDTPWSVTLNSGANADAGNRRMASTNDFIRYDLYRDAARLNRWGDNQATGINGLGDNTEDELTVYGRVFAQPAATPGSYSDTITVTLIY